MDPTFCRCMFLIAAAFFAGTAGSLRGFESAYLHHTLDSIRTINEWLSDRKTRLKIECLQLIGNLVLTEVRFVSPLQRTMIDRVNELGLSRKL